jgi:hypothetical protein
MLSATRTRLHGSAADGPAAASPAWADELGRRGVRVLPPTTAVPVELYGLLPDGRALHFLCRGTSVSLRLYAAADVALAVGVREAVVTELPVTGEVWLPLAEMVGAPGLAAPGRAVFTGAPVASAGLDGRARFGWTGHEAGLLRGASALPLFVELLDSLLADDLLADDLAAAV